MEKSACSETNILHLKICRNCEKATYLDKVEYEDINPAMINKTLRFCTECSVFVGQERETKERPRKRPGEYQYSERMDISIKEDERNTVFDDIEKNALYFRYTSDCIFNTEHRMIDFTHGTDGEVR